MSSIRPIREYDPPMHMCALGRLFAQIDAQLSPAWQVFPKIGVITDGATVRTPDLVIVAADIDREAPSVEAARVALAIEIISPESASVDTDVKPYEYADARIPYFWLVDPVPPVTVTAYSLADTDYEESQRGEGIFVVSEPVPLRIDLAALAR
ncbi:Uma2 family endonuclease [Alloactinosynnema sp. L-07]|uniref:Uma2 family endonuclease n=1 Tax=Alloactinosynnema sp. L-07 TaxID=1653480 RepID=UPI0009EEF649|nr:Uma2 family endonuclease [Alloactinosynnema sp. L-07]